MTSKISPLPFVLLYLETVERKSESKGRFLNPIFYNKKKRLDVHNTRYPRPHPQPPKSDNIIFLPYPSPSLKVDVICVSPVKIEKLK